MESSRQPGFGAATLLSRLFGRKDVRGSAVPPGRRIYAIGDVHGRLDLFDRLLAMIEEDQHERAPMVPEIVLLGDLIDRGPDSAGVVRRAMAPPAWARVTALMGNHEVSMIDALQDKAEAMRTWLDFGGHQSLLSWGVPAELLDRGTFDEIAAIATALIPREELCWIAGLRQHVHIGDYYFVHAGIRPGIGLEEQLPCDNYWIRGEFLESRRDHGAIIVHGHTISPDIDEQDNRIGIDTGAYDSGRLTALALEGEERWFLQT
jgi:serine/threonine protein phosphatase 1